MFWYLLLAFLFGVIVTGVGFYRLKVGVLKVYIPDQVDESPYLYTELDKPVDFICKRDYVLFKIDVRHVYSQDSQGL